MPTMGPLSGALRYRWEYIRADRLPPQARQPYHSGQSSPSLHRCGNRGDPFRCPFPPRFQLAGNKIHRARRLQLARDLPAAWNSPSADTRTKQRLVPSNAGSRIFGLGRRPIQSHILVQEIVYDLDNATSEAMLLIHWTGGRHSEVRVPRVRTGRYPADRVPAAVDVLRQLAGPMAGSRNRRVAQVGHTLQGAVSSEGSCPRRRSYGALHGSFRSTRSPVRRWAKECIRMRCKTGDGETWTTTTP